MGRSQKGFTLLEILIALVILATVISTLFMSYTGTFRVISETQSQTEIYSMARVALNRIQEDIESVYITDPGIVTESDPLDSGEPVLVGENETIDGKDADSVRFFSTAHISFRDDELNTGLAEISYYVGQSDEQDGLTLYRSDTLSHVEPPEPKTEGAILCQGLDSVNFTYHDTEGNEYESWDSSVERYGDRFPALVSIRLAFLHPTHPDRVLTFLGGGAIPLVSSQYDTESEG